MKSSNKTIALALSGAFALSIAATSINAAENPFAIKSLSSGYQVADHHEKMKDGKCGEGKCGTEMKKEMSDKAHDGKMKDGKCGEGKCGAEMKKEMSDKAHDGKMKDGKCGEGKCGTDKK